MKRVVLGSVLSGLLWGGLEACASKALVGDNSSRADGGPGATVRSGFDGIEVIEFELSEERVVAPTWRYDFACTDVCGGVPDVRVAADGRVWAAPLGGHLSRAPGSQGLVDASTLVFVLLDSGGKELALYGAPQEPADVLGDGSSALALDDDDQPYLLRWPRPLNEEPLPRPRRYTVEGDELAMRALPGARVERDTAFLASLPDGSVFEFAQERETRVIRYAPSGEVSWRTTNLRAVPNGQPGQNASQPPLCLSDGSIVLDELKKPRSQAGGDGLGLTVLGPDGRVRWDMTYDLSPWPFKKLAAGLEGSLVLAGVGDSDSDLEIFVHGPRGDLLRGFRGARTGYHGVAPRALGVDAHGDVYVAVVVGERTKPRLGVCRLTGYAQAPARCVALDLESERSGGTDTFPYLDVRMEIAEPGAVLLALRHKVNGEAVSSIVRLDLNPLAGDQDGTQ